MAGYKTESSKAGMKREFRCSQREMRVEISPTEISPTKLEVVPRIWIAVELKGVES